MPDVFSFSRVRSLDVRPKPNRRIYRLKGMFSGRVCAGETGHVFGVPASRTFVLKGKGGALHRFSRCIDDIVAVPRVRDFAAIYRGEGIRDGLRIRIGFGVETEVDRAMCFGAEIDRTAGEKRFGRRSGILRPDRFGGGDRAGVKISSDCGCNTGKTCLIRCKTLSLGRFSASSSDDCPRDGKGRKNGAGMFGGRRRIVGTVRA